MEKMKKTEFSFSFHRFIITFLLLVFVRIYWCDYVCAQDAEVISKNAENNNKYIHYLRNRSKKSLDLSSVNQDDIINTARSYIGTPHCSGGHSKNCADCSGFIMAVFAEYDVDLPHNSQDQSCYGELLQSRDELKPGDLVFFYRTYNTSRFITHTGIYLGNNKFIHASSSHGVIVSSLVGTWWEDKFIFGTRIF